MWMLAVFTQLEFRLIFDAADFSRESSADLAQRIRMVGWMLQFLNNFWIHQPIRKHVNSSELALAAIIFKPPISFRIEFTAWKSMAFHHSWLRSFVCSSGSYHTLPRMELPPDDDPQALPPTDGAFWFQGGGCEEEHDEKDLEFSSVA